jgi:hypothetical protein
MAVPQVFMLQGVDEHVVRIVSDDERRGRLLIVQREALAGSVRPVDSGSRERGLKGDPVGAVPLQQQQHHPAHAGADEYRLCNLTSDAAATEWSSAYCAGMRKRLHTSTCAHTYAVFLIETELWMNTGEGVWFRMWHGD